jgi:hypothetical protein
MKPTPETATAAVSKLALMAFFPADPDIRAALVTVLLEMVETEEQMNWLVNRCLRLYGKWPGVAEIRAVYCSRWKPKDGLNTYSTVYIDGIPSEKAGAAPKDAPRGEAVTRDPELNRKIQEVADKKKIHPIGKGGNG